MKMSTSATVHNMMFTLAYSKKNIVGTVEMLQLFYWFNSEVTKKEDVIWRESLIAFTLSSVNGEPVFLKLLCEIIHEELTELNH